MNEDSLQLTVAVCVASVYTQVPALDTVERSLQTVISEGGSWEQGILVGTSCLGQSTGMRCC